MNDNFVIQLRIIANGLYNDELKDSIEDLVRYQDDLLTKIKRYVFENKEITRNHIINSFNEILAEEKRINDYIQTGNNRTQEIIDHARMKNRANNLTQKELSEIKKFENERFYYAEVSSIAYDTKVYLLENLVGYFPETLKNRRIKKYVNEIIPSRSPIKMRYKSHLEKSIKNISTDFQEIFISNGYSNKLINQLISECIISEDQRWVGYFDKGTEPQALIMALTEHLKSPFQFKHQNKSRVVKIFKEKFRIRWSRETLSKEPENEHIIFYENLIRRISN